MIFELLGPTGRAAGAKVPLGAAVLNVVLWAAARRRAGGRRP